VVDDDLPAVVSIFEDEREQTFGVATIFFAAFKMVFANDDGEVFVERMDLEIAVSEGAHGCFVGIVVFVFVEQPGKTTGDLMRDEEGVGRVFIAAGKGREVAIVPGVLLRDEDFDDVQLLARGRVKGVGVLPMKGDRYEEGEQSSDDAE